MAIMGTGLFPQDLRPGINAFYGLLYENYPTEYDKLFDVKTPEARAYEEDVMVNTLGLPQVKPQGSPITYDNGNQLYSTRYTHVVYGSGFVITKEMLNDGVAIKMGEAYSRSLKMSMLRGREIIAANVYVNAFSSSYKMDGGDGSQLCVSTHTTPAGNQSNVPISATSLSEASLEQACIDIAAFNDNRGQLIMALPDKLIIPPALEFTAKRILMSPLQNNTADNAINILRADSRIPGGIQVAHYLTSTTNYFIRTNQEGLIFWNREDIAMSDDNEFDTNNAKFKSEMRFSQGWSDWRSLYGVNA